MYQIIIRRFFIINLVEFTIFIPISNRIDCRNFFSEFCYIFKITCLFNSFNFCKIEGDLQSYSKAEQYLNMIKMSDKALKEIVHYFEKVDEPTVIVFFGDHQPDLEETFYNRLLHTDIQKLEGEDLEQLYKVPFLIWANYDIIEENVEKTSNNYLSF